MTVSSQTNNETFFGNGVTTIWDIPFRFFDNADIKAYLVDPVAQTTTLLVLGTNYTLSGAGLPEQFGTAPGKITTTVPVPSGKQLYIERDMDVEQLTDIVNQGRFFPEVHEDVFDRLTMFIQQAFNLLSRTLKLDIGGFWWDFLGLRGVNVGAPINPTDAATKGYVDASSAGNNAYTDNQMLRTVRSPGETLTVLPSAVTRAGKLLSFDASGQPVAIAADSQSATDLELRLSLRLPLFLLDFGAIGDGSDETAKVQAAVTAASVQNRRLVGDKNKTYKITAPVLGGSNVFMQDIALDASAMTSPLKHALVFEGTQGANSLVTVDVAANAFSITVANGAIYTPGEWVLLTVDSSYYPFPGYNVARGEWVQIRSIAGNVINTTTPIVQAYTVATGATLRKINFVENILLDNVKVTGSGVAASAERGICLRFARYFEVRHCELINLDQYEIEVDSCIKFHVHHNRLRGTFYDGVTGLIFYGIILLDACQYFTVHNNHGSRVRHLVVSTAMSAGQGKWGQAMFGIVHNNVVEDAMSGGGGRSYAYEVHGTGQHQLWADNIANGCYAFMRIEGGSDIQVVGGGCNGYAQYGIIFGGNSNVLRRIHVEGVALNNYTGELTGGAALRFETCTEVSDVRVIGVTGNGCAVANVGQAVSISASTTMRNIKFIACAMSAGAVENNNGAAVSCATGTIDVEFQNCNFHGWRNGYNFAGAKCRATGGAVANFAAGGTGFGFYSNGDRNICKDVHFRFINTVGRMDTLSTNNLMVNNTFTDCITNTVSNGGTGNVVTPNFTV